jgi:hypothetical protein
LKLTIKKYKECRATGEEGSPQLRDIYDQVVADLVDKHKIVDENHREGLRIWLDWIICGFFEHEAQLKLVLTDKKARVCQDNIEEFGKKLRKELYALYSMPEQTDFGDAVLLNGILSRARQYQLPRAQRRPTKQKNAEDLALQVLGQRICVFWVVEVVRPRGPASAVAPPAPTKSSAYFKFAKYIYELVGRNRSDPMISKRLGAAKRWYLENRRGDAPPATVSSGAAYWLASGASISPPEESSWMPNKPKTKK